MIQQSIAIRAPIKTVYDVIVDFESYPDFLSEIKEAKVDWCEDHQVDVTFRLYLIREITYTLRFTLKPLEEIQWVLRRGELLKKNSGSWKLEELEKGLTDATYNLDVEFGLWVPKAITEPLLKQNLPQTLERFKKQVEGKNKGKKK